MKIVGKGKEKHILHDCRWCGELIDEPNGDDKVAYGSDYFHCGCFEDLMEQRTEQ